MARQIFQAKQGLLFKAKELYLGGFDLNRFFKWMAAELNIPTYDKCCDTAATAPKPVRFEDVSNVPQYFNGTDWATLPVPVAQLSGTIAASQVTGVPKLVAVPSTATSTGVAGQVAYDATGFYVCVATNTWVKATLATF